MLRWRSLPAALLLLLATILVSRPTGTNASPSFSAERKRQMRELIRTVCCGTIWSSTKADNRWFAQTWQHGFNNYMRVAFPLDELRPISCTGQGYDRTNPSDLARNDVCGDFALTLVDSLDSFVVFGDHQGFKDAVRNTIDHVSFDKDVKVQVFEVTIRVLGGLLSVSRSAPRSL